MTTLRTARLLLRPFSVEDAPRVHELCSERDIAATTAEIPHPYPEGAALHWISSHAAQARAGTDFHFALVTQSENVLVGSCSLAFINHESQHGELGFWVGKPYWRLGYASEAAREVVTFGFKTRTLHRIMAHHFSNNPASGRVLEKIGMTYEGCLREHRLKWGHYLDLVVYGILRREF